MKAGKYWVWRRRDGYVGCTKGLAPPVTDTFEVLLETEVWAEAQAKIKVERGDPRHQAFVASWEEEA